MSLWDAVQHRLHVLLHPRDYDRELAAERAFHLELESMQQAHAAQGRLDARDASAAARRRFGNVTRLHEDTRHMAGLSIVETLQQDLRFAFRSFRRAPVFTLVATLTLAIGIGANTAIYSALDALLFRPLPFAEPERLMKLSLTRPARGENPANDDAIWSYLKYRTFRDAQRAFTGVALHSDFEVTVRSDAGAERVYNETVAGPYFSLLGARPALGRTFAPEEDSIPGGPRATIISHALFTRMFNADSSILGRTMRIGGEAWTIVGVMGEGFKGMSGRSELWQPVLVADPDAPLHAQSHSYRAIGRIAPGLTVAQAKAATAKLGELVDDTYPDADDGGKRHGAIARELDATRVDPTVRRSLHVLAAAVAMVLLIACANVANLFLVRAAGRGHEIGVRMAMGATRGRLVRQLMTESTLLSLAGGAAGVVLAWFGVQALSRIDAARAFNVRRMGGIGAVGFTDIRLDGSALLVALGLALLTGLVFGTVPALHSTRASLADGLRRGRGRGRSRLLGVNTRNVLVAVEIALAVVLLASSGLMMRSLGKLLAVSPGFRAENLLTFRLNTPEGSTRDSLPLFYEAVRTRLAGVPGVTSVTMQDCPPLNGGCNGTSLTLHDRKTPGPDVEVGVHWIVPNWPETMGVALKSGRPLDSRDRLGAPKSVLLSESAARRLLPTGGDPVGLRIGVGQGGFDTATVVGVVADVRYGTIDKGPAPDVYMSHYQSPRGRMMLMVATSVPPEGLVSAVRAAVKDAAPDVPMYDVRTMASRVSDSTAYVRFGTLLLGLFAAIALLLSALGVYGVISFTVSQRTREIGIRMALGAVAPRVARMIIGEGLGVAVVGVVAGVAVAFVATRVLESLLYGVSTTDPLTFVTIVSVLLGAVVLASWIPARRAARIAPTEALREE